MKFLIKQRVFSWSDTFDIYDEYENKKETNRICNDCSHDDGHRRNFYRWGIACMYMI